MKDFYVLPCAYCEVFQSKFPFFNYSDNVKLCDYYSDHK